MTPRIIGLAELLDARAPGAAEETLFAAAVGAAEPPAVIVDGDRTFERAIQSGELRCGRCARRLAATVQAIRAHRCA